MTDRSRRTNRHGIPLYDPPEKCIWPRCQLSAAKWLNVHLCEIHAGVVTTAVVDDRERIVKAAKERIAANIAANVASGKWTPVPPAEKPIPVIYYLQVGGHLKIGWTSQLEQRMRSYPPNTTLLAIHPGTRADERQLHKRFAVHRSHGNEWYPLVPVILDHIKRMVAEHGEPPTITFGARPVEVPTPRPKNTMQARYGPMKVG